MIKTISACGLDCSKCYCNAQKMCTGCHDCKGKVFHCPEGQECAIYHCCVTQNSFSSCLECPKIPCDIWQKTRDPKFSDEEFAESIRSRIRLLKEQK